MEKELNTQKTVQSGGKERETTTGQSRDRELGDTDTQSLQHILGQ